jgi:hypothetical protein
MMPGAPVIGEGNLRQSRAAFARARTSAKVQSWRRRPFSQTLTMASSKPMGLAMSSSDAASAGNGMVLKVP